MTLAAGVDVGGTTIRAALVELETGSVVADERTPTKPGRGGHAVLSDCVAIVRTVIGAAPIGGVGIGLCEFIDLQGSPTSAFTIDWRGSDIAGAFREIGPVRLESDVRAAAVAEGRFGAGRRATGPWIYVTVGTGISYTLMFGDEPYRGARGNAISVGAPAVEAAASGLALQRTTGADRVEDIIDHPEYSSVLRSAAEALGISLAALVNALDPELIVMGGGLGLVESYRTAAIEAMRAEIEAEATRDVRVVPARLASLAGSIGAAIIGAGVAKP